MSRLGCVEGQLHVLTLLDTVRIQRLLPIMSYISMCNMSRTDVASIIFYMIITTW
ncbi:hypothetical protein DsansV1_C11g0107161 [Dioscorea sansibarensis]